MYRRDCIVGVFAGLCAMAAPAGAQPKAPKATVLVVGDSLSAEYGLARGSGWVALLTQKLQKEAPTVQVVNASISGDTTSGGRARLPALLKRHQPTHVILELGANDALRGLPLKDTATNLTWMTEQAQALGARVVLVGMQMPPNYGAAYGRDFAATFPAVAQAKKTALVPFFLKGIADQADPTALFQSDRIHPNASAQPTLLANVWPVLQPLLPR